MPDIWFISDLHLDHANILTFKDKDGNLIRPGFTDVNHMNEHMIEKWNSVVKPGDKIYVLGDFGFTSNVEKYINRLNGKKRLILGNHDDVKKNKLHLYFEKIQMWRVFREENFVATHVPIHPSSLFKVKYNVHGHTHQNIVIDENGHPDKRYFNVSVERLGYTPLHIDELVKRLGE
jgi:calcineurin-like phosphoesterase family protein